MPSGSRAHEQSRPPGDRYPRIFPDRNPVDDGMTVKRTAAVLVNGEAADCVSSMDRGLLYGDGVFETLCVEQGAPVFWRRHMKRLLAGCERLAIDGIDVDMLCEEARTLAAGVDRGVLKIIITRGSGGRGYGTGNCDSATRILQRYPAADYPAAYRQGGVNVRMCRIRLSHNPRLAGIKHLNRLEQVLARSEWNDPGIQEGLVLDLQDRLVEGTMSNVFLLKGGMLFTPDLSRCGVAGIMRSVVMELAERSGLPVQVATVRREELAESGEVFLCNSLIGIWPVRCIDDRDYVVGPVTRQLQSALAGLAEQDTAWLSDEIQVSMND